jgi:hypothetical protein
MDAAPPPHSDMPAPPLDHVPDARQQAARAEALLDALKTALAVPGEHRLFRSGKLPGLFASKVGPSAEAALFAIKDGLIETARTELKGKIVTEWVRATPKAVAYVHENDSSRAVLRELKSVLAATKAGVPEWLAEARQDVAVLSARFESRTEAILKRLDDLALRVEAALRRAETSAPGANAAITQVVPWVNDALEYLDRRPSAGLARDCSMPELFHAVKSRHPDLTLSAFQAGIRRLHDIRAVRLRGVREPADVIQEPEYAFVQDGHLTYWVNR